MFTAGDLDADPQGRQPLVTVATMLSLPFDSDDVAEISDELIASTVGIQGGTIVSRRSTHFAVIAGHRVDAPPPMETHTATTWQCGPTNGSSAL